MAQKVNPISVRLNLNRSSDSSWFSDYYYGKLLYQDVNFRDYSASIRPPRRNKFGFRLGRCIIHHSPKRTFIHVFYLGRHYRQSRPTGLRAKKSKFTRRIDDGTEKQQNEVKIWPKKRYGYPDRSPSIHEIDQLLRVSGWMTSEDSTFPSLSRKDAFGWKNSNKRTSGKRYAFSRFGPEKAKLRSRFLKRKRFAPDTFRFFCTCVECNASGTKHFAFVPFSFAPKKEAKHSLRPLLKHFMRPRFLKRKRFAPEKEAKYSLRSRFIRFAPFHRRISKVIPHTVFAAVRASLNYLVMQYFFHLKNQIHFDPINIVSNLLMAQGVAKTSTLGKAKKQRESLDKTKGTQSGESIRKPWSILDFGAPLLLRDAPRGKCWKAQSLSSRYYYWKKMQSLLSDQTNTNTLVKPVKITCVYKSASSIAQEISCESEQKKSFRQICISIFREIENYEYVKGIRIRCSGRLKGAEIAKTECRKYGKTSLHVFSDQIDYAKAQASTPYGILGVKVWVSYS
uniref:ribosomal protein S3 n=1 Tax=Lycopodium japonicum TaxID=672196 RepID=UPI0026E15D9D|nr:ribosomal protein S3 [Lycopodium japonicum]WJK71460.1 ribosomal protein S3 [Lycopodium japonicum]